MTRDLRSNNTEDCEWKLADLVRITRGFLPQEPLHRGGGDRILVGARAKDMEGAGSRLGAGDLQQVSSRVTGQLEELFEMLLFGELVSEETLEGHQAIRH